MYDMIGNANKKLQYKLELFCIKNLLFNITKHELVPKHEFMNNDEAQEVYNQYSIKENQRTQKLPLLMTKTDPVSKYYDFKPGSLIKITRPSSSIGESISYRYCV
jgi:DNA-directed RNA polymerase I, II, and III subunit RPABC1